VGTPTARVGRLAERLQFDENIGAHPIRIAVTGFTLDLTATQKKVSRFGQKIAIAHGYPLTFVSQKLHDMGGVLVDDLKSVLHATHVVASNGTDQLKRTPKLMVAFCRTTNIVNLAWLTDSIKAGEPLACDNFLIMDATAEKLYGFTMRETLKTSSSKLKRNAFLLDGWSVFICHDVAGNKAPPADELQTIVIAAGGMWLDSPTDVKSKILVITSDPATKNQLSSKYVASALRNGASKRTIKWLFDCIMTQRTDLE
jgi:hypothetical protein